MAAGTELVAPYVPTPREDVDRMLELADVGPGDYLIDLGSGDGRIVITAALRGAMGHGVELDGELVETARRNARRAEVDDLTAFRHGDIFEADLSQASVVTLYLMPEANLRLRPKLLSELRPGTRVVSNSFDMDDWQPDRHVEARSSGGILLWIVPARIHGRWSLTLEGRRLTLEVTQHFQTFEANLHRGDETLHVMQTVLRGERIAFRAGDGRYGYAFSGRMAGQTMGGVAQIHGVEGTRLTAWQATRR